MFKKLYNWAFDKFTNWLITDRPAEGFPLSDFERIRYEVRPCDVLLIEGRSRISDIIRGITQSSWSHSALYIGRLHDIENPKIRNLVSAHFKGSPDSQMLIEGIMGKGIIISDITTYKQDHVRICRPRGLSRHDAQKIVAYSAKRLGTPYDVRQILDLGRFLLPWFIFPRRLRSQLFELNAGESTKTVCSSMLAEAFSSVEFPILPLIKKRSGKDFELIVRNPKLYTPRDFDYSPYFDIIKYPFIELADYGIYHHLPWNKEGFVSHDSEGVTSSDPLLLEKENPTENAEQSHEFSTFKKLKKRLLHYSQANTKKSD